MTEARPLSPYERSQVRAIAAWKSRRPSVLSETIDTLTSPVTWAVGHFIPRAAVTRLVNSMEAIAVRADVLREVADEAGVASLDDIAALPLEECDALARLYSARAERFATVEAAVSSFGGPLFHVPQQLVAALRSITRIGHCYGYRLDEPRDHALVIDILEIATLRDVGMRQRVVETLHAAVDAHADALLDDRALVLSAGRNLIADEVFDLIPVVGTAVSFLFDSQFMHGVDEVARRIFQERWLRDRGLATSIPPCPVAGRESSLQEFSQAIGQTLYSVGAVVGFVASFPARFVQHAVGSGRNPASAGFRHGADHAVRDAREFLTGLNAGLEDQTEERLLLAET